MSETTAVRAAIDLVQVPSRVRYQQTRPLPPDVVTVLRIAAGDAQTLSETSNALERSPALILKAAAFFIEQILLCPDADSYRVLGANKTATAEELRRNMALLLRWLHPDSNHQSYQSIFARRVTKAWEDLKTPKRRAAYDSVERAHTLKPRRRKPVSSQGNLQSYASRHRADTLEQNPRGFLRRAMSLMLGRKRYLRS